MIISEHDVVDFHDGATVEGMETSKQRAQRVLVQELVVVVHSLHVNRKALIWKKGRCFKKRQRSRRGLKA